MVREVEELRHARARLEKHLVEVEEEAKWWKEQYTELKMKEDKQRVPNYN